MKRLILPALLAVALPGVERQAHATYINLGFAASPGANLQFNGNDPGAGQTGSFSFLNNGSGNAIMIVGSDGTGDSTGTMGTISGSFNIGAITTSGSTQSAPVTGTGTISIADGSGGFLTGTIDWLNISTFGGSIGGLNTAALVNLSNISYSGSSLQDFLDFGSNSGGEATLQFVFSTPRSLTQLTQNGTTTNALAFSGSLSNAPVPSSAIMILSLCPLGLAGMFLHRRRNRAVAA
jgi:hypothetical protein